MADHKYCYLCQKTKPTDEFYKDRRRYDGLRAVCKPCDHLTRRLRVYRLSLEEFMAMWARQGARCDICSKRFKSREAAVIDHHHGSGRVRSLLCNRCNGFILPLVESEGALLERAKAYLLSHGNMSVKPKRYNSRNMRNQTRNTYRSRAIRHDFENGLRAEQRRVGRRRSVTPRRAARGSGRRGR